MAMRRLGLLWLAGMDLRLTLLAVPPVLPLIHAELGLDEKGVAALAGLPILLFGLAAIPGSLLIARVGARRALIFGLCVIGLGSALRGVGPSVAVLFAMTVVMGAGIAISQPTFPALVRGWFGPARAIARATGFWSNGLLVGELLAAALSLPLLALLGTWPAVFVFWSVPVFITAGLVALGTRDSPRASAPRGSGLPNWRSTRMWQLGLLQSSASMVYFGANTFIPDYLHTIGQADLVGAALAVLNGAQVPASFVIGLVPLRVLARRATSLTVAAAILVALAALLALPGSALVLVGATGVFGFCAAYILVLSFALPALLAEPGEVARLSAGTFGISYTTAFLVTLLAGALWDATRVEASAFLPALVGSAIVAGLGPRLTSASVAAPLRRSQA
jgi:CP family cyanate transporter-like MFS transporter